MVVLNRIASLTRLCSLEVERCCVRQSNRQQLQIKRAFSTGSLGLGLSSYSKSKASCSLQAIPSFGAGRRGNPCRINSLFVKQNPVAPALTSSFQTTAERNKKSYYDILGVQKGASQRDIKKSYYELAKKYHPDTNKDKEAEAKFQEIQQAYEILSDDQKRATYDQFGTADPGSGGFGGQDPFGGQMNADDIFKSFFGQFNQGGAGGFGFEDARATQNYMLNLSFAEAVSGVNKDVKIRMKSTCTRCNGKRAEPGSTYIKCPQCNGTGEEKLSTGFFHMRSTCRKCGGQGHVVKDPCRKCHGSGSVMETKTITVPVPAGVDDGLVIKVPTTNGDLYVTFKVTPSKIFERDGADVHSTISVNFAQALLGGSMKIPGLQGDIDLKIPKGAQSHQQMKLIGKGIPRLNGYGRGDHYVHIKIYIPKYLNEKQKALIAAFAELDDEISGTVNGVDRSKQPKKKRKPYNFWINLITNEHDWRDFPTERANAIRTLLNTIPIFLVLIFLVLNFVVDLSETHI
eukprot:Seg636.2 transcript_id=Seg636.2/GoldUCD/mRNA.D3Y31 product="DnaJ subfamily A member 3 mitochondrial" protein_id=Seg636.2/GoldUCD/D3Y31